MLDRLKQKIGRYFLRSSEFDKYHEQFDQHEVIHNFFASCVVGDKKIRLLDVGGGDGKFLISLLQDISENFDIAILDIETKQNDPHRIVADICDPDLSHADFGAFDGVFSYNSLEHFADPITAARNMCKFLSARGFLICATVFSWRYHPVPDDYYRFSDSGLRYLFSQREGLQELTCGYDLTRRREDIRGGYFDDRDIPPIDLFGGFRENWSVCYIGRRG